MPVPRYPLYRYVRLVLSDMALTSSAILACPIFTFQFFSSIAQFSINKPGILEKCFSLLVTKV